MRSGSFPANLLLEDQTEADWREYFHRCFPGVVVNRVRDLTLNRNGCDYQLTSTGGSLNFEVKVSRKESEYIFIEVEQSGHNPGWMAHRYVACDFLFWMFLPSKRVERFHYGHFWQAWVENREQWEHDYNIIKITFPDGHQSKGIWVPIEEVKQKMKKFEPVSQKAE